MKQSSSYILKTICFIVLVGIAILLVPKKVNNVSVIKDTPTLEYISFQQNQATTCIEDSLHVEKILSKESKPQLLSTRNAKLKVPSGALFQDAIISLTALTKDELPPIDQDLVNVTKDEGGVRCLPHGLQFRKEVNLHLAYDTTFIPTGYFETDIRTFYFDEEREKWMPIPRDTLLSSQEILASVTTHFTDFINGILKTPDAPETHANTSNSIKDLKAADPSTGILTMTPPMASNTGSAALQMPLKLPDGRQGLLHPLAFQYNSDGGNGWMGIGWDISISSIRIDTRWGVPRYDPDFETEIYTVGGKQLSPVPHRDTLTPRTSEKQFYPRIEGEFQKIIRHGDNPSNYWWEVTDKDGTRSFYGGTESGFDATAALTDEFGNVAHWGLREVRDLNGNFIRYYYDNISDPGVVGSSNPGHQLYIDRITYTGHGIEEGKYVVQFFRDRDLGGTSRQDVQISGRLGFKQVTADLLKRVEISFDGQPVRSYELEYLEGAFYKQLLAAIIEVDIEGQEFYRHEFEYFDEVRQGGNYQPYNAEVNWNVPSDGIKGGLITGNIPDLIDIFNDGASMIGGTSSNGNSKGMSLTFGPNGSSSCKTWSVGGNGALSGSESEGLLAFVDINGDGLPDKVFRKDGKLKYRESLFASNDNTGFSSDAVEISGVNQFSKSKTEGNSWGLEANLDAFFVGYTNSKSEVKTNTYFADFNGDGLIDIAHNGRVFFNHIDSLGNPCFTLDSGDTPNQIIAGAALDTTLLNIDPAELDTLIDENPLHDIVRVWEAPFSGTITVNAPISLYENISTEAEEYKHEDGVRVVIQFNDEEKWATFITPDQAGDIFQPIIQPNPISVEKGDRFYFRVQSIFNGAFDQVIWNPVITYTDVPSGIVDANGKYPAEYHASGDFLLAAPQVLAMPLAGNVEVEGIFEKSITSDDVRIEIVKKDQNAITTILYSNDYTWNTSDTTSIITSFTVDSLDEVSFRIVSSTNIDWSNISWKPRLYYDSFDNGMPDTTLTGEPLLEVYPVVDYSMYNDMYGIHPNTWIAPDTAVFQVSPFSIPNGQTMPDGRVTLSVKGVNKLYGKQTYYITNNQMPSTPFEVSVDSGDVLFIEYHIQDHLMPDTSLIDSILLKVPSSPSDNRIVAKIEGNNISENVFVNAFVNVKEPWLGPLYRGWGFFVWNGNREKAMEIIDKDELKIQPASSVNNNGDIPQNSDDIDEGYNPANAKYVILYPDCNIKGWRGFDNLTWIMADTMSSSRFGEDDIRLDYSAADSAGATAPRKITKFKSHNVAVGVSASGFGSTDAVSFGKTEILYDVQDMNGDNYPEIISKNKIQFTNMLGGLEEFAVNHSFGNQKGSSTQGGISFGGDMVIAKFNRETGDGSGANASAPSKCANGDTQATDAQKASNLTAGVSGNIGGGNDETFESWLDVNGDGLPDKVYKNGDVAMNLGYRFLPKEEWNYEGIQKGKNTEMGGGANLGVNYHQGSVKAGFGISRTTNGATLLWQDVNDDGLSDILSKDSTGQVFVRINKGNSFATEILWEGVSSLDEGISIGESANSAITYCFNFFFFRVCVNPSGSLSHGISRQESQITDVDGDGFPDFITSENDGELKVKSSTIGKTNLLKKVIRPFNSHFTIDYARAGNTYDLPHNQWVMTSVDLYDGFAGDGVDWTKYTFDYEDGYYDRREREFYGFETVKTTQLNTGDNDTPYREVIATYENRNYYTKGLLLSEVTQDAAGNKYLETVNTYQLRDLDGIPQTTPVNDDAGSYFPALLKTEKRFYEGQPTAGLTTTTTFDYDLYGNVTDYSDTGDGTPEDLLSATITYHDNEPNYIKSLPSSITVNIQSGQIRYREADIDNKANVTQIRQYLENGEAAVFDMSYYDNGNLQKITRPPNHQNQRLWFEYEYDDKVQTYVTKISDAYGYSSSSAYEYLFGQLLESTDLNNQMTKYEIDNKGRITTITGPYELKSGKPYTIAFEYHPEAQVPHAITKHYDAEYDADIETITFMDGLMRPIQVKKTGSIFSGNGSPDQMVMIVSGKVHFDAFGRTDTTWYPITEPLGNNEVFNLGYDNVTPTISTFDILDRTLTTTLPDGSETAISYSINQDNTGYTAFRTSVTDALGNIRETFTDVRGRQRALMAVGPQGNIWTGFRYNAISELLTVIDDVGNLTEYTYDHLGRKLSYDHPDSGKTEFGYDFASNNTSILTAQLRTSIADTAFIKNTYDHERLFQIDYPKNYQNKVQFHYGEPGAPHNRAGRVWLQEDASGGHEYFYGPLGEVVKDIRTLLIDPTKMETYVWETKFDSWGRVQKMVYPDGEEVDYGYNRAGKVQRLTSKKKATDYVIIDQRAYDEFEQPVFQELGNGTVTYYEYDAQRRWLTNMDVTALLGRKIMDCTYTYDAVANILSISNNTTTQAFKLGGPATHNYEYDELYRLTGANGQWTGHNRTESYTLFMDYDNLHNIVRKDQRHERLGEEVAVTTYDNQYTYGGNQPHVPTKVGQRNYTYDANGNFTGWTTERHFSWRKVLWDEENRISAISDNGFVSQYTYDASGERAIKSSGGVQSVFNNGAPAGFIAHQDNYTAYVSPYLVAKEGRFTKHYFIEGQRIASRIGTGRFENRFHHNQGLTAGNLNYNVRAYLLTKSIREGLGFPPGPPTGHTNLPLPSTDISQSAYSTPPIDWVLPEQDTTGPPEVPAPLPDTITNAVVKAGYGFKEDGTFHEESNQYFFHPDHLGSTSYVTDRNGEVRQHIEYMPFGETFVDEHTSDGEQPYLYTSKELDRVTGLYYYIHRYYDPMASIWLSVDPLAEMYPGWSPYNYTLNNPINYVDPDGRKPKKMKDFSTPIPEGFKRTKGIYKKRINGVLVIIKPDKTSKKPGKKARTDLKIHYKISKPMYDKNGIVIRPGEATLQFPIQAVYDSDAKKEGPSGYGRGTTKQDILEGNTSLEFHEGQHGLEAIRFLEENKPPAFFGKKGMTKEQYKTAIEEYKKNLGLFAKRLLEDNRNKVHNVGKSPSNSKD